MRAEGCAIDLVVFTARMHARLHTNVLTHCCVLLHACYTLYVCIYTNSIMRAEGCAIDLVVFTAAIGACAKGGEWQKALQLLQ
jgi:hypothetical protein